MIGKANLPGVEPDLNDSYSPRIELSLDEADQKKRRLARRQRIVRAIPLLLLAAPIVGWRLILAQPDGVHVAIGALSWLAFVLDVGVQVNTSLLQYLGLEALPTVVGVLLLLVITMWVLAAPRGKS